MTMKTKTNQQKRIKKAGILKHAGIVLSALIGVFIFVLCFALYVWVNETPRANPGFTGFSEGNIQNREHTTIFIAPDLLIAIDKDNPEVSFFRLETPITDDSLRVFSKRNAVMVDGYIKGIPTTEISDISKNIWDRVLSGLTTSNFTRLDLLQLSRTIKNSTFVENASLTFPEQAVVDEELTIMVQNGTNISGLASEATQWVKNIGGRVVEVGNAPKTINKTQIVVLSDIPGSPTVARLVEVFGLKEALQETSKDPTRFDVIITIGNDFYGR